MGYVLFPLSLISAAHVVALLSLHLNMHCAMVSVQQQPPALSSVHISPGFAIALTLPRSGFTAELFISASFFLNQRPLLLAPPMGSAMTAEHDFNLPNYPKSVGFCGPSLTRHPAVTIWLGPTACGRNSFKHSTGQ